MLDFLAPNAMQTSMNPGVPGLPSGPLLPGQPTPQLNPEVMGILGKLMLARQGTSTAAPAPQMQTSPSIGQLAVPQQGNQNLITQQLLAQQFGGI